MDFGGAGLPLLLAMMSVVGPIGTAFTCVQPFTAFPGLKGHPSVHHKPVAE
jgi:hypothetical protein